MTAAGRMIVGLSYVLELNVVAINDKIIFFLLLTETGSIILLTLWYEFVDRSWFLIQFICLIIGIVTFLYFLIMVPESTKWQYTWEQYDEAKKSLVMIAKYNGNDQKKLDHIKNAVFDTQVANKDDDAAISEANTQKTAIKSLISESTYIKNVIVFTILWSTISFIFYCLVFLNKYLEGSMYLNFYLEGVAGILGTCLSLALYKPVKMFWAFIISIVLTFIGILSFLLF